MEGAPTHVGRSVGTSYSPSRAGGIGQKVREYRGFNACRVRFSLPGSSETSAVFTSSAVPCAEGPGLAGVFGPEIGGKPREGATGASLASFLLPDRTHTMKPLVVALIGAVSLAGVVSQAHAARHTFATTLSGAAEEPPVDSPGTGTAIVLYDGDARTLTVKVEFADLREGTTVAHIHAPTAVAMAGNIGVASYPGTFPGFPVGVTEGTYQGTWSLAEASSYTAGFYNNNGATTESAEAALLAAMFAGKAYVNVHTSFSPPGEIRGFLVSVPDQGATLLLLVPAFGALLALRRQPRR